MKRNEIVARLIEEGLSSGTLMNMTDKQLQMLSERMLSEQTVISPTSSSAPASQTGTLNIPATDQQSIVAAKNSKKKFVTYEGDMNEEKPSAGLSKEKKSEVVKKAKKGEDIGKKGKGFEKVVKAAKKSGAKDPKAVAAAAMWKNIKREEKEPIENLDGKKKRTTFAKTKNKQMETLEQEAPVKEPKVNPGKTDTPSPTKRPGRDNPFKSPTPGIKVAPKAKRVSTSLNEKTNWIGKLVESVYHPLTSKGEIMEIIRMKLNETDMIEQEAPVKEPQVRPDKTETPSPTKRPGHDNPFKSPTPGIKVAPKAAKRNLSPEEAKEKIINLMKTSLN